MDRLAPTLVVVGVILLILALMAWGWRSRQRRQARVAAPASAEGVDSPATVSVDGLYVATTHAGQPLERISVHGLGFQARVTAAVHPEGIVLSVRGRSPFLVPVADVRTSGRATWTIDRVVEKDGLVRLGWMLGTTAVDSYLRLSSAPDAAQFLRALGDIAPDATIDPAEDLAS